MSTSNEQLFYKACIDACETLDKKKQLGTYVYNILKENGLIDSLLNDALDLNRYTDDDLKTFRGLGNTSVDIIRIAWNLYTKEITQKVLDIDPAKLRGYSIGKDIIRWIKNNNLENKPIYYVGNNRIGFIVDTHEFEGMEYHTTGDLNVYTGEYIKLRDYIS